MNFASEIEDGMMNEMKILGKLQKEQFTEYLIPIFSFLCGGTGEAFMEEMGEFCEKHGVQPSALKGTMRSTLIFFREALKHNLSGAQIRDDLLAFALPEELADEAVLFWKQHFLKMARSVADSTLQVNQLVDMEWRFGITSASSELNRAGNTFLQLKLVLQQSDEAKRDVNMELSLPEFYDFLHQMEVARNSLDLF